MPALSLILVVMDASLSPDQKMALWLWIELRLPIHLPYVFLIWIRCVLAWLE